MDFAKIETFLVVAKRLNFSQAAEEQHLSQSAVSRQIRQLEAELGVKLFERDYKKNTLTPAGRMFYKEIHKLPEMMAKIKKRAQQAEGGFIGRLRIGFISTAAADIVPQLISRFRQSRPEVVLELLHALTATQIDMLVKKRLDVGFFRIPTPQSIKLTTPIVHKEPFKLFIPAGHPLAFRDAVPLQSLHGEPFVVYAQKNAPGFHTFIMQKLRQADVVPSVIHEAADMYTLLSLVSAGLGLTLAPVSVARYKHDNVIMRDVQGMPMSEIAIAFRPDLSHPAALAFIKLALSDSATSQ